MAAPNNTITTNEVCTAMDQEFVENFTQEYQRLEEVLGLFGVETVAAGTTLFQYEITGQLASTTPGEGEESVLSKYEVAKTPIDSITPKRYDKMTTAEAILKSGFANAVTKTDRKFSTNLRSKVVDDFFTFLTATSGIGSVGSAEAASVTDLQSALAYADAALGNALEANDDEAESYVFFVNRNDIAAYLAKANISTQTMFGMDYLEDFLGVKNIFITNKVAKGNVYVTPVENIHPYGIDFGALDDAGLSYETNSMGLIGIHHEPDYNRGSARTHAMMGMMIVPEIKNYIIKATIVPAA